MRLTRAVEIHARHKGTHIKTKKPNSFLYIVSCMSKLRRYLTGGMIGMCFEYVYRVDSEVWYLPLSIGVLMSIAMIVDVITDYR